MRAYVSLLRGINVSGQKLIKMDQLRELYESLGFDHVRSYIQSGNVIFTCPEENGNKVIQRISSAIEEKFGYEVTVFLRTSEELQRILENSPFLEKRDLDPKKFHVMFLAEPPEQIIWEESEAAKSGEEDVASIGREFYIYLPAGAARTKLTNMLFERKLKMPATARNWRTVTILAEMAQEAQGALGE